MTKQELLEKYTSEQITDRIIELEKYFDGSTMFNSLQSEVQSPLQQSIVDNYEAKIKQKEAKISKLEKERDDLKNQRNAQIAKVNELKSELQRKETIINQIDDILNELFGVMHDIAKPDEFKKILKQKAEDYICDNYLPKPIKIADKLIDMHLKPLSNPDRRGSYVESEMYYLSCLRQIAEHIFIYLNARKEYENGIKPIQENQ